MTEPQPGSPATRRRWPALLTGALLLIALGAGSAWGALTILTPAEDPLADTAYTFVEVVEGEVGASLTLNTIAQWTPALAGVNRAQGVVTSVQAKAGDNVSPGATLYTVNLRPVVIAEGDTPAFRTIGQGAEGPDVEQLQVMLGALGFYRGSADGKAEERTVAAIKAWQQHLNVAEIGEVGAGDIIFVPSLPTRVVLNAEVIKRGASLSGGEDAVQGLSGEPRFWMPATDTQAGMLTTGTRVDITAPDGSIWQAQAGDQKRVEGAVEVALTGIDGGSICGEGCNRVPPSGQASLASQVITVATTSGLVVPSAALVTQTGGQTAVIDSTGTERPVEVKVSAKGMSVITGVDAGTQVRLPPGQSE